MQRVRCCLCARCRSSCREMRWRQGWWRNCCCWCRVIARSEPNAKHRCFSSFSETPGPIIPLLILTILVALMFSPFNSSSSLLLRFYLHLLHLFACPTKKKGRERGERNSGSEYWYIDKQVQWDHLYVRIFVHFILETKKKNFLFSKGETWKNLNSIIPPLPPLHEWRLMMR